jgi:hypothetical protein
MPGEELDQSMSGEEKHTNYFAHTGWNLCCKQATYLLLKKEELQKLSFKDEAALKFHLAICKFCRAFRKQSVQMNELIARAVAEGSARLGEKDKNNLKLLIDSNLNSN